MNLPRRLFHREPGKHGLTSATAAALAVALAGCATPPPPPIVAPPPAPLVEREVGPVLARDEDFAVVLVQPGEDLAALAERYLDDRNKAWWIAELNGAESVRPGEVIAVPLRPRNAFGVHSNGYQAVPVLTYHRFGSKSNKLTVTPAAFDAQLDYLAKNGYRVISLQQFVKFLEGREPLPKNSVVITIDDGYRSTYEVAYAILARHGFPATVFLYSDFVGAPDALTWAQMKEMVGSGLIEIQPHSKTHSNLTVRLPGESDARYRERMAREVEAPIGVIRERLGAESITFAYPYGDVNETIVELLARKGIALGATVTPGGNGFFVHPRMLRRSMIFGDEGLEAFKARLATFVPTGAR